MTITQLETQIATYLGRDTVADLVQNGQDIGLYALNSARRRAEQAHDFKLSELNCFLSIGANGASVANSYVNSSVAVTGTLSPNVVGTWALAGTFNAAPFYTIVVSTVTYFLSFTGIQWNITTGGFAIGSNYWSLTTITASPTGTYTAHGSNTGSPVVAATTGSVIVKRVKYVSLPLNDGEYEPIEFITSDEYTRRARIQTGRQNFFPGKTLANLGVSYLGNPLCYQNGLFLYLAQGNVPLPQIAQLSIVQFMPDYTSASSADWFMTYAPEFLYWQGIIECNNFFKRYTSGRIEGQVDTAEVQGFADKALDSLIQWDISIVRSTNTPESQGTMAPPQPSTPAPQQAAA